MNLKLYIMTFTSAHFGDGTLNSSVGEFDASRLFSALYLEALKLSCEEEFLALANKTNFVLSDAFPYHNHVPYLPKPIGFPQYQEKSLADLKMARKQAKTVKKLRFIPHSHLNLYLEQTADLEMILADQKGLSNTQIITRKGEDPYEVGVTFFDSELYVIASQSLLLDTLMTSLQYSGLGGKRTSGLGQFQLTNEEIPEIMAEKIKATDGEAYMSLSTSLPTIDEMAAVITGSKYLIKKSSGFVYSEVSDEQLRKQDLYKFKAGSTFSQRYTGQIVDVRPDNFPHPVWNYAKSLFYSINI